MGEFISIDNVGIKQQFGRKENIPVYLQFIPGVVIDVVISEMSPLFKESRDINSILAKKHSEDSSTPKALSTRRYYPLLRGMVDTPIKGDQVLLCDFGGVNYYFGPLNSLNSPNFNIDTLNTGYVKNNKDSKAENKSTFRSKFNIPINYRIANVPRLQKVQTPKLDDPVNDKQGEDGSIAKVDTHGDMLFEGRYGNSIRIGSRGAYPLLTISNGRNPGQGMERTLDGSLFGMLTAGSITDHYGNFILASDFVENNSRLVAGGNDSDETSKFDYEYGVEGELVKLAPQIFLTSDKITINARKNNVTLSSFLNMDFGAGNNLTINTKNYTSIESSNIYLGKQAQEENEPLVLGNQLKELLEEIIEIFESLKVTGCIAGMSGPIDPGTLNKVTQVKQKLSNPKFFSEYHFIEENGQKTE